MGLVPAKCLNCGANIEIDASKESGVCKFCGTEFITEKVINHYHTNIVNNYAGATFIRDDRLQQLIDAVDGHLKFESWEELEKTCNTLTYEYPKQVDGWWGLARIDLENKIKKISEELYAPEAPKYGEIINDVNLGRFRGNYPQLINRIKSDISKWRNVECENLRRAYDLADEARIRELDEVLNQYRQRINEVIQIAVDTVDVLTAGYNHFVTNFNYRFPTFESFRSYFMGKVASCCPNSAIYYGFAIGRKDKRGRLMFYIVAARDYTGKNLDQYFYFIEDINRNDLTLQVTEATLNKKPYVINRTFQIVNMAEENNLVIQATAHSFIPAAPGMPEICPSGTYDMTIGKAKFCYVATSVYDSYDCPNVWTLRRFRDEYLAKSWCGRAFISTYYAISPIIIKLFGETRLFNAFWKGVLDRWTAYLKKRGYKDTPYYD